MRALLILTMFVGMVVAGGHTTAREPSPKYHFRVVKSVQTPEWITKIPGTREPASANSRGPFPFRGVAPKSAPVLRAKATIVHIKNSGGAALVIKLSYVSVRDGKKYQYTETVTIDPNKEATAKISNRLAAVKQHQGKFLVGIETANPGTARRAWGIEKGARGMTGNLVTKKDDNVWEDHLYFKISA